MADIEYAGFWFRFVAYIIDVALITVFIYGIQTLFFLLAYSGWFLGIMNFVFVWFYYAFLESSPYQGTFGKQLFGLQVTDEKGKRLSFKFATIRYFAKILSALLLCIGFFMIGWTKKKQGLHDEIAHALVVKT